jgi:hypothetical protein
MDDPIAKFTKGDCVIPHMKYELLHPRLRVTPFIPLRFVSRERFAPHDANPSMQKLIPSISTVCSVNA